jgi:hypothetical protein
MSEALKKAFDEASRLSEPDQDRLAGAILEELALTQRWEATLTESREALEQLADEALAEHRSDATEPLDPNTL